MKTKEFTQIGKLMLFLFLPLFTCFVVISSLAYENDQFRFYMFGIMAMIFFLCLLTFYKMSIKVTSNEVSFKMGVGILSRTYKLRDIEAVKPVRNNLMYGIGIRLIPEGWLYNVSGAQAVELKFKNKSRIVRIGTDKPIEVAAAIEEARVNQR